MPTDCRKKSKRIEKNLSDPKAWEALSKAEAAANNLVFNESIELLGGIALRDAHLDADICDLAEALIQSIRASGTRPNANVIPGSISSMMMTIEPFIRLRFPEWTVWGLPLAAHEVWRVSARAQYDNRLANSLGAEGSRLIKEPTIQQCLGDAFATYFMGPAYAFAAFTLLFDPTRDKDDLRVYAIESMLRLMDPTKAGAFSESYGTLADNLALAWKAAKQQAARKPGRLVRRSASSESPSARFRAACSIARSGTTIDPSKVEVIGKVVATLFDRLTTYAYSYFSVAEWKSARNWADDLQSDAAVEKIKISDKDDLRHVLNAVWLARLDAARTEDISKRAHRLAHRMKVEMAKRPPEGPGGPLRGLT